MSTISLTKNDVSVIIQTLPLMIEVQHKGKPLIRRMMSEVDYECFGHPGGFHSVIVEEKNEDYVALKYGGGIWGLTRISTVLKIRLEDHFLEVTWDLDPSIDYVSDTWVTAEKTHWYGQGQIKYQVFPLDEYISEMKPFLADNIQVPFWLSKAGVGVLVDSYQLFEVRFDRGVTIRGVGPKVFKYYIIVGEDFRDARLRFLRRVGLPEKMPDRRVLTKPVFSTWVEYKKDVNQEKVMEFLKNIRKHDFPCSVIQIDDKWEKNYGDFTFDLSKFPDPKSMVDAIHEMGYLATLWVYPFINYESENYDYTKNKNYLVLDPEKDEPAHVMWWDGSGGLLDISNPEARGWFNEKLKDLKRKYGFDGFKFDAGDGHFFPVARSDGRIVKPIKFGRTYGGLTPNQYTDEWLRFISENHYDFAEVRVGYLAQRFGIIAREGDKESTWGLDNGLHAAITQALTLSLTGYMYIMPDMIGGNQYRYKCDKELFIRWAEAASLMPIVEYSITPWTYDEETVEIAKRYTLLHESLSDYYISLAIDAKEKGEPILCPLVLRYVEDEKCSCINDEFLVGNLLAAPIVKSGVFERSVYLPEGTWLDFWNMEEIKGPIETVAKAPLDRLPLYAEVHDLHLTALLEEARKKIFRP
jgi:alpha-glucosidase (family GH31 glycosyl hydrolase)